MELFVAAVAFEVELHHAGKADSSENLAAERGDLGVGCGSASDHLVDPSTTLQDGAAMVGQDAQAATRLA